MRRTLSLSAISVVFLATGEASAAVGGPDLFGYTFADQDSGTVYNYVDITATGTVVTMGDNTVGSIALGAPFDFYGVQYNSLIASSNGFLTDDPLSAPDASPDCPFPATPSSGGGFRINALHDNLNTTVRYQYFNQAQAAAIGFPGETAGVSIFQWTGTHVGGGPVDVEAVLFHDDSSVMTMVAADPEGGSASTSGIQNATASTGLDYACDTAMSIISGVTAVLYSPGGVPDSNCCSASPSGTPGCINPACQDAVCAMDASCCSMAWDGVCGGLAQTQCQVLCLAPPAITINEIRIDQPGIGDNDEYFELFGPPGTPLTDIQYIVLGDGPTGEIEAFVDLSGSVIPPSGYLLVAEGSFSLGPPPDRIAFLNFENTDTVTHMLVGGLTAAVSDNLDVDGDGVLDSSPWIAVLDTVALVHPASAELPYGPPLNCTAGPTCQEVDDGVAAPFQVFRCPNGVGTWQIGNQDPATIPVTDSPGGLNDTCVCGNGVLEPPEQCDDGGESPSCDIDCTLPSCGDSVVNASAGEQCDEMGETVGCDPDCSLALCGDGFVNMTAGEQCDGSGETALCNLDCTPAMCGDGQINMTAGEDCDDSGESATCDADCTDVSCGDGTVNATAGEACDGDGMGTGGETATCNA
ncbi:MAG: hypothetical protein KDK70_18240, partial [Myxococcales bacterium]|nr:hypothetical protein [Myxococcales bacterium]